MASLEEVLAAHKRATQLRQDRASKGKDAAMARRAERTEMLVKLRGELEEFAQALEEVEDKLEDGYFQRAMAHEEFDEQVRQKIQSLIKENGGPEPMDTAAVPRQEEQVENPAVAEIRAQRDALLAQLAQADELLKTGNGKSQEEKAANEVRMKDLQEAAKEAAEAAAEAQRQKEAAAAAAAKAAAEEAEKGAALFLAEELDVDLLPKELTKPTTTEQMAALDKAWYILEQVKWVTDCPVTYDTLGLTPEDVSRFVGEQWACLYPVQGPLPSAVVHPQLLKLLAHVLQRMADEFLKDRAVEERKTSKLQAKEALVAQAKKRRL